MRILELTKNWLSKHLGIPTAEVESRVSVTCCNIKGEFIDLLVLEHKVLA